MLQTSVLHCMHPDKAACLAFSYAAFDAYFVAVYTAATSVIMRYGVTTLSIMNVV